MQMGKKRPASTGGLQPGTGYEGWRPGLFAKEIPVARVEDLDAPRMWTEYIAQRRPVCELLNFMHVGNLINNPLYNKPHYAWLVQVKIIGHPLDADWR
jgi:hypothetical protein